MAVGVSNAVSDAGSRKRGAIDSYWQRNPLPTLIHYAERGRQHMPAGNTNSYLVFGRDLSSRYGRMTLADYLALFAGATNDQRVGEASSWYLYSRTAAREIKEFSAADIIVILRNPIDMIYALHSQLLFQRQEEIVDFKEALASESERRQGHRIPRGPQCVESFFYRDAARFSQQLERYLDVFGREKVHVILYDDLCADTPLVYRRMLEFLGVDPVFTPSFEVHNRNKRMRFTLLQDLVYRPPLVRRLIPKLRRYRIMHALRNRIIALNSREASRQLLDVALRKQLVAEFEDDIHRLGALIGRDLSHWTYI
jgi:hypothetical protein